MAARVVGFVFARGGSKGIPNKNLAEIGGIPLVVHSIRAGMASTHIDHVIVSTDSPEIARVAVASGASVPTLRPSELATDDAREWDAWRHAILEEMHSGPATDFDVFVSIPPTSPLRTVEDVDRCIERYLEGDADIVVTVRPAERNPWFNMVTIDELGRAHLAGSGNHDVSRRQDAPEVWDLTTVAYVTSPQFVLSKSGIFDGNVTAVVIPRERALDIDDEMDLEIGRFLYERATPDEA